MRKGVARGQRKNFVHWLIRHQLRRFFAGIHVRGHQNIPHDEKPILYYSNHIAQGWDFCIGTHLVYKYLKQDPFVMTDESAMPPLADWGGAYSVNQKDSLSVARAIRYSVDLTKTTPNCALWIFPQGMMKPVGQRPLGFQNGIQLIIRQLPDLTLVPVTFFYTFCNYIRLEAFVNFGEAFSVSPKFSQSKIILELENRLTADLDILSDDIAKENVTEFETIMTGKRNIQDFVFKFIGKPLPPLKTWRLW